MYVYLQCFGVYYSRINGSSHCLRYEHFRKKSIIRTIQLLCGMGRWVDFVIYCVYTVFQGFNSGSVSLRVHARMLNEITMYCIGVCRVLRNNTNTFGHIQHVQRQFIFFSCWSDLEIACSVFVVSYLFRTYIRFYSKKYKFL